MVVQAPLSLLSLCISEDFFDDYIVVLLLVLYALKAEYS